ncbi:MAG: hypothetical protein ACRCST_12625 [Turicibacter sp.]
MNGIGLLLVVIFIIPIVGVILFFWVQVFIFFVRANKALKIYLDEKSQK